MRKTRVIYLLAGILGILIFQSCNTEEAGDRPNIVIFIADDTGYNDVGYNGSVIKTPHIDRLAGEGLVLDQYYVYMVCSPTRAALMTGRPPSRFGLMRPLQPFTDFRFEKGTPMLASLLKSAGYETCIDGKWHLGMEPDQLPGCFGFDHAYGYTGPWIDSYSHLVGNMHGDGSGIRHWQRDGELIEEHGHVTDLITREAVSFISERRDRSKPFFLYVAYSAPHVPCQEPKAYTDPYEGIIENNSRLFFAASMTHLDESIGEITQCLEEEGISDNTLVIFMSDNGGQRGGDYGATGSGWLIPPDEYNMTYALSDSLGDNYPFRSWKGTLYEGGIRVPAIVSWPGRFDPGIIETPLHVCDWVPTLAGLAGASIPADMQAEGMDVMPLLEDNLPGEERTLYWRSSSQHAVRKGPWKLIRSKSREDGNEEYYELFNIDQDPSEAENLTESHPEIVHTLMEEMVRNIALDAD